MPDEHFPAPPQVMAMDDQFGTHTVCTRATNSVSCSALSPVIASYRKRLLRFNFAVWPTTKQNDGGRCLSSMTPAIRRLRENCKLTSSQGNARLLKTHYVMCLVNYLPGRLKRADVHVAEGSSAASASFRC
jgi:hypothetical protein